MQSDDLFLAEPLDESDSIPRALFWGALLCMFVVIHLPVDRLLSVLSSFWPDRFDDPERRTFYVNFVVVPSKALVFYLSLGILVWPLFRAVRRAWGQLAFVRDKRLLLQALVTFVLLCFLVIPIGPSLLGSMGIAYGGISSSPFCQDSGWFYRRLLKPAVAHLLQLEGFLYWVFSLSCTFVVILLTLTYLARHRKSFGLAGHHAKARLLPLDRMLLLLSIATSSYIIYDYYMPGYTDQFIFILILLGACVPMTSQGRLAIVVLAQASHEIGVFCVLPIILVSYPRRDKLPALTVIGLYFLLWLASFGFDLPRAFAAQAHVAGEPAYRFLFERPHWLVLGSFMSYKLLWGLAALGMWVLWKNHLRGTVAKVLMVLLFPMIMLPLGVDTSRLVGFGFLALLACVVVLDHEFQSRRQRAVLRCLYVANLVLPSFYCALNDGIVFYPGLYKLIARTLHGIARG